MKDIKREKEITALKRLVNVQLNDELVRKVSKKELKREQKREHVIAEYSISTDSGIENEKPQRKKKKKAKKVVRVKTKKHKKKA